MATIPEPPKPSDTLSTEVLCREVIDRWHLERDSLHKLHVIATKFFAGLTRGSSMIVHET
jgi:hypothetical protein